MTFPKFDKNGNGAISMKEFQDTIGEVNNPTIVFDTEEMESLFEQLDANGDGGISLEEFENLPTLLNDRVVCGGWCIVGLIVVISILSTQPAY